MKSKILSPRFLFITIAIVLAALSRVLPHPFNFTPIGAMALFGGACLSDKRIAFLVPLMAMLISDCILGFHNTLLYVYVSFIIITFIGMYIRNNAKTGTIILASLVSSLLFFLITNFGVWASDPTSLGMTGLINTYLVAIPFYSHDIFGSFFLNTIMGDLFFNGLLFGSLYFAQAKFPALAKA